MSLMRYRFARGLSVYKCSKCGTFHVGHTLAGGGRGDRYAHGLHPA